SPGTAAGLPSRIFPFRFPTSSGSTGEREGTMTTHHRWAGAVAVVVGLVLASPARAGGIAPDLDKKIHANPAANKPIRVIVQFSRPGVDSSALARAFGGQLMAKHPNIRGATLSLPQSAVAGLSHNPNVAWISPDRPVQSHWDYDAETVGADKVWATQNYRGTGVRVAVLDTGVYAEYDGAADWNRWGTNTSRL